MKVLNRFVDHGEREITKKQWYILRPICHSLYGGGGGGVWKHSKKNQAQERITHSINRYQHSSSIIADGLAFSFTKQREVTSCGPVGGIPEGGLEQ